MRTHDFSLPALRASVGAAQWRWLADQTPVAAAIVAIAAGLSLAAGLAPSPASAAIACAAIVLGTAVLVARLIGVGRRLQALAARYSALTDVEFLGIATWRADGSLIDANDAFLKVIGESRDRAAAGAIRRSAIVAAGGASLDPQAGSAAIVERTISGRDGTARSLAWGATWLAGEEVLTFALDITDRVAAEQALRHARSVLEARVRDLESRREAVPAGTTSLDPAPPSVVALAERLASANAEFEAFTYSVAHDLRAPLRAIDGFSRELLSSCAGNLGEQGQHYLDRIRAGTQRMGSLIDGLLELSRVSRADVRRQSVDLSALAGAIVDEQRAAVAPHAAVTIAPALTVDADQRLLRVILANLLGNALKFSAKSDAPRVELFRLDGDGTATFCVRDNGAGFDMRYADKLFTPFHRLHSVAQFEGTGIGLALVHRAVTRHGGGVRAESEPGRGTSVFFTLQPAVGTSPGEAA